MILTALHIIGFIFLLAAIIITIDNYNINAQYYLSIKDHEKTLYIIALILTIISLIFIIAGFSEIVQNNSVLYIQKMQSNIS